MKAKDLANILLENPDFEIVCDTTDEDFNLERHLVIGIVDIGYSDKKIILDTTKQYY